MLSQVSAVETSGPPSYDRELCVQSKGMANGMTIRAFVQVVQLYAEVHSDVASNSYTPISRESCSLERHVSLAAAWPVLLRMLAHGRLKAHAGNAINPVLRTAVCEGCLVPAHSLAIMDVWA